MLISKRNAFLSLKIVFVLANIVDPDEMSHSSGPSLFANEPIKAYQYTKG